MIGFVDSRLETTRIRSDEVKVKGKELGNFPEVKILVAIRKRNRKHLSLERGH